MALGFFSKKKKDKKDPEDTTSVSVRNDDQNDVSPSVTQSEKGMSKAEGSVPVAEQSIENEQSVLPQENHSLQEEQEDKTKTAKRGFFSRFKKKKTEKGQDDSQGDPSESIVQPPEGVAEAQSSESAAEKLKEQDDSDLEQGPQPAEEDQDNKTKW